MATRSISTLGIALTEIMAKLLSGKSPGHLEASATQNTVIHDGR
ncbi:MAG: hypothetical protein TQ35_0007520 [Candidatus Aramenus sulfurataquae]|uniref:Uncharacterized protein n=1 Tax=Candidatus Aramenus sulfurataquae TaxID=1326980 RepID=A0ACC6TQ52_9CREN